MAALMRDRDCNQEGSDASTLALKNKTALGGWNSFSNTDEAKAAAGEKLSDLGGGNTHRPAMQAKLREEGITSLEDTAIDYRTNSIPPRSRGRGGAAGAAANDRGYFRGARGGGFAGRGVGRTESQGARLDPALESNHTYTKVGKIKSKLSEIAMVDGKVTMKPAEQGHGSKKNKKKSGRYSSPRLDRPPLPDFISHSPGVQLAGDLVFEAAMQAMLKKNIEEGKHVLPIDQLEKETSTFSRAGAPTQEAVTTPPVSPLLESSPKVQPPQPRPRVHHIKRAELGSGAGSPDAFTDGNATTSSLSGFSPSLNNGEGQATAATSLVGLGIRDLHISNSEDAVTRSDDSFEEYKAAESFFRSARPGQDFALWLKQNVKDGLKPRSEDMVKQDATAVNITRGYTIGVSQLRSIIGDKKNLIADTKSTQTTPGLRQSRWASHEGNNSDVAQTNSRPFKTSGSREKLSSALLTSEKTKLETIEEVSSPERASTADVSILLVPAKPSENNMATPAPVSDMVVSAQAPSKDQVVKQQLEPNKAFEKAACEPMQTLLPETKAIKPESKLKHNSPVAIREQIVKPYNKISRDHLLVLAAQSNDPSRWKGSMPAVTSETQSAKLTQSAKPDLKPTVPSSKRSLSASKWSNDVSIDTHGAGAPLQTLPSNKASPDKRASLLGDSKNLQRSAKAGLSSTPRGLAGSIYRSDNTQSLPKPAPIKTTASKEAALDTRPKDPIISSPTMSSTTSIIGDSKNIQKSPLLKSTSSRHARDPANKAATALEQNQTRIKRTSAGPGYERLMKGKAQNRSQTVDEGDEVLRKAHEHVARYNKSGNFGL
ncbi:uncharacterized protein HMPREF1541_00791 [Cyphellophora europaea CBS 101466]|uniref:Uncharacterized protein n=1 Tax=Cyphellophora europaea (strain CBS 101466) TaxID=1220924 RepID=W2SDA2_CYPE1|nr:uncharacterized protein HMPREF1541_00791 [Cyphellophora europaea CBS 101466]ETN46605.1 hypothetical protein HMPREF1541_00791 [Cyphellophora europaea CBS 101466]